MDLQNCIKMGETYFCKGKIVLLTDLTNTCIGSLCMASTNNIQWWCKFSIGDAQEKIFGLDSNTYVVYSLRTIITNHICPKAKTISAVQIKSGQAIKLNLGCYIRTMDHVITADETTYMEVHSKWLDWTWTLGELFQQPKNEIVTTAIEKLRTKILREVRPRDPTPRARRLGQGCHLRSLDIHLPWCDDCWSHDHLLDGPMLLEEMLPGNYGPALSSTICSSCAAGCSTWITTQSEDEDPNKIDSQPFSFIVYSFRPLPYCLSPPPQTTGEIYDND